LIALLFAPLENLELGFAVPMFFGRENSSYVTENFDVLDRKYSIVIGAKLSGSLREGK